MKTLRKFPFILAGLLVCLAACIGTGPQTPTRFYLLTPDLSTPALAARGVSDRCIEIRSLELPQYLERPQMVTRHSDNQLDLKEFHQWAGNLRKNMIRVMVQNLGHLLSTPQVFGPPVQGSAGAEIRIFAQVMAFEADASGRVTLTVQWQMVGAQDGKMIASDLSTFQQPAAGGDMAGIAAAMSRALADFCRVLATAAAGER